MYVGIFSYLYFALRYLQGKTKIFIPLITCILAIGFHFSSIFLLPSLFVLFLKGKKEEQLVLSFKRFFPYLIILVLLFILSVFYVWRWNPLFLEIFVPLLKGRSDAPGLTLLSFPHLLDILNEHLLLSQAGVVLFLGIAIFYKKRIGFKQPIIFFLIIVSITQLLYHLLVDPKLGAGRDWDLFSSVGLGFTLLGVYLFIRFVQSKRYLSIVLIFAAFISTLPWFLLNASSEKGIDRFKNLLDLDLKRGRLGRMWLARYYYQQNRFIEAKDMQAEFFKMFPEDSLTLEAETCIEVGEFDRAIELLKKALAINPRLTGAYSDLGRVYLRQGKVDEALEIFQELTRVAPLIAEVHLNLGDALFKKGRFVEALKELKKGTKLGGGSAEVYNNIAYIHSRFGEAEEAIKAYKKALKIDPGFYYSHSGLGQIYLDKYLLDEALVEFDQAVRSKPDYAPAHYNLGFVYSRKGLKEKALEEFELFLKYSSDETKKEEVKGWISKIRSQNP